MYTEIVVNLDFQSPTKQKAAKSALPDFQVGWSRMGDLPVALPLRSGGKGKKKKRSRHVGIGLSHWILILSLFPFITLW